MRNLLSLGVDEIVRRTKYLQRNLRRRESEMSAFADLKKKRSKQFEELREQTKKTISDRGYEKDPRFWTPTFDKSGRSKALIRFLPPPAPNEAAAVVRMYNHYFKGMAGEWYRENCRSTIGERDPVNEMARRLWDASSETAHDKAREIGRRQSFISNIYVIKDPANVAAEGKVFLYQYPKAIFEMINAAMNGSEDDELSDNVEDDTFPVFDFWASKDFKLDVYKRGNFNAYDKCAFVGKLSPMLDGDDESLEEVWKQQHSLEAFHKEDNFKSYDDLLEKFLKVMGADSLDDLERLILASGRAIEGDKSAASRKETKKTVDTTKDEDEKPWDDDDDDDDEDVSYLDDLMKK